jgi:hypothetical protein
VDRAINEARTLYDLRCDTFSQDAQTSVVALGNLLEYATRARKLLPDLHGHLHNLERHWQKPDLREDGEVLLETLRDQKPSLLNEKDSSGSPAPLYVMHTLPRLCEYSAQAGREDHGLRELAEDVLKRLHHAYNFFDGDGERLSLKQDAASATIRAAAHIATWKMQDERPDLRSVRYIAECGRDRLETFSKPLADHTFALFQLSSGKTKDGLEALKSLVQSPYGVPVDVRIASLDQLTGWHIRLNELDRAREALSSLREAIERDSTDPSSSVSNNFRVRAEEASRMLAYEKLLSNAE